jgi:hypothetical protein
MRHAEEQKPTRPISLADLDRAARTVSKKYGMALGWTPAGRAGLGFDWNEDPAVVWNTALVEALNGQEEATECHPA